MSEANPEGYFLYLSRHASAQYERASGRSLRNVRGQRFFFCERAHVLAIARGAIGFGREGMGLG